MYLIASERGFYNSLKPDKEYEISGDKLVRIGSSDVCVSRRPLSDKEKDTLGQLPTPRRFTKESFAKVCTDDRNQLINDSLQDLAHL